MQEKAQKQHLLYISRQAPYGSDKAQLCLEMALAATVFDQQVSYLFLGDGVYQLLKEQQGKAIESKTFSGALETLDLYGIENIFVDEESLSTRNLHVGQLMLSPKMLSCNGLSELMASADKTFTL